jgi:hypothetical protein
VKKVILVKQVPKEYKVKRVKPVRLVHKGYRVRKGSKESKEYLDLPESQQK